MISFLKRNINKKNSFYTVVLVLLEIFLCFLSAFNTNSKTYFLANKITDYSDTQINRNNAPILRVTMDGRTYYNDLFSAYHYTQGHSTIYSFRQFISSKTSFVSKDGTFFPCLMNNQPTLSISDDKKTGYYIDDGLFESYYKNEIFEGRGYLNIRFNCNGFVFISDTLADKLCDIYGIDNYYDLILNEEYAVLGLLIDGEETITKFCINNVLYSSAKNGPRVSSVYGDFCLFNGGGYQIEHAKCSVEFDLKKDSYGIKSLLTNINKMGYNRSNSSFDFAVFDNNNSQYVFNNELKEEFNTISFDSLNSILAAMPTVCSFLFSLLFLFDIQLIKEIKFSLASYFTFNILFFIVCQFVFIPPLIMVFPIVSSVAVAIYFASNLFKAKMKKRTTLKGSYDEKYYFEIEI